MKRFVLPVLLGIFAAVIGASLMPSLPGPLAFIEPALILTAWYVVALRPGEAFAAALAAGIARDALSSLPPGAHIAGYAAATFVAYVLFTRVFTNHGWPGLLGLGTAAVVTRSAALTAVRFGDAMFSGLPAAAALPRTTPAEAFIGLAAHLVAMLVCFGLATALEDR
ncbi:MAG: hypothetical protein RLZZ324_998, partial [Candidatus Parcubacteria bacterium]